MSKSSGLIMKACSYILHKILMPACVYFTVLFLFLSVIVDSVSDIININVSVVLMCFFMALFLALSDRILFAKKITFVLRVFLHMVFSILSVSVTVALFSLIGKDMYTLNARSFYLVLLLVAVYFVADLPVVLLRRHFTQKADPTQESVYTSIFSKK